jgi:hypothetical protein
VQNEEKKQRSASNSVFLKSPYSNSVTNSFFGLALVALFSNFEVKRKLKVPILPMCLRN